VWLDLLTPKQILFFDPLIKALKKGGAEVLATSRRYREVEQLAKLRGLELSFVGERGGKVPVSQLLASLSRMQQLLPRVQEFQPDVAVSVASADCARICFGMRIRHIAVNDSPHSEIAARLSIPLTHHLFTPWIVTFGSWTKYGIRSKDITRYRALDPAAWLKRERGATPLPFDLDRKRKTILVRVEETYATYMIGKDETWTEKVLERLRTDFSDVNVVVLCRYDDQLRTIRERFGSTFLVPEEVVDGASLIRASDLFIGMGGTMTAEAALIGVPTISAFQGGGLFTEKFLISKGVLAKTRDLDRLSRMARRYLDARVRDAISRRAKRLLDSMEDPIEKIASYLLKLPR
jgi:predicted glycosyltransferase